MAYRCDGRQIEGGYRWTQHEAEKAEDGRMTTTGRETRIANLASVFVERGKGDHDRIVAMGERYSGSLAYGLEERAKLGSGFMFFGIRT